MWEESVIFAPPDMRFLCLSATIPNADEFADWIKSIKKHPVNVIFHDVRYVPLHHSFYTNELGITDLEKIKEIKDIPQFFGKRRRGKKTKPFLQNLTHTTSFSLSPRGRGWGEG